jgi:hypothetical protein
VSGLPEPFNHFVQERSPVTASLSAVDHEQRPNVTCLMVCAGEALNPGFVLGHEENRLVEIPVDFRGRNERRVIKPIFSRSMPHLGNPRQVELCGLAQTRGHRGQIMPVRACLIEPFGSGRASGRAAGLERGERHRLARLTIGPQDELERLVIGLAGLEGGIDDGGALRVVGARTPSQT